MEVQGSFAGALIPMWILGTGRVAGVLAWPKAPPATMSRGEDPRPIYSPSCTAASQPGMR
jgi:hypothetical protein